MKKLHFIPFAALSTLLVAPVWATTGTLTVTTNTTLSEEHNGNIVIAADSITLDCAGLTVTGASTGTGIALIGRRGVTVTNCRVTNFENGFALIGSNRNVFIANEALNNNDEGFDIEASDANIFMNNQANQNDTDGFDLDDSHGNIFFQQNTANENGRNGFELDRSNKMFSMEI